MSRLLSNHEIADAFERLADLLAVRQASPFRVRAWRRAARVIEGHPRPLAEMVAAGGDPTSLPGIGRDIGAAVHELVATGRLARLEGLEEQMPSTLLEVLRLPGMGPVKVERLWRDLGVRDLAGLETAAREGRVAGVAGFGPATEQRLLAAIAERRGAPERLRIDRADRLVAPLLDWLGEARGLRRLEVAGELRRRCETVSGLRLVAAAAKPGPVIARFLAWPSAAGGEAQGPATAVVRTRRGDEVELAVAAPAAFGALLLDRTGAASHLAALADRARRRGLELRPDGLFDGTARLAGGDEEGIYRALGLAPLPPELREGRDELARAARRKRPPRLVELGDIRGDLQMHTTWSDGRERLETMVQAQAARGRSYLAVTDHGPTLPMVQGLDRRRLPLQWREIAAVQAEHPEIRILRSCEVDILADGSLDLDDDLLAQLEVVVVAVHTALRLPREAQTRRLLAAIAHPRTQIFAHPLARRLGRRGPIEVDLEAVLAACAEHGVAVEANAQPERLDLPAEALARARELGVGVVISTDAHRVRELDALRYGVDQARRAGLEPRHVLNTLPVDDFLAALRPPPAG